MLEALAIKGGGPVFYKINSRTTRYYPADLEEWLETKRTNKASKSNCNPNTIDQ